MRLKLAGADVTAAGVLKSIKLSDRASQLVDLEIQVAKATDEVATDRATIRGMVGKLLSRSVEHLNQGAGIDVLDPSVGPATMIQAMTASTQFSAYLTEFLRSEGPANLSAAYLSKLERHLERHLLNELGKAEIDVKPFMQECAASRTLLTKAIERALETFKSPLTGRTLDSNSMRARLMSEVRGYVRGLSSASERLQDQLEQLSKKFDDGASDFVSAYESVRGVCTVEIHATRKKPFDDALNGFLDTRFDQAAELADLARRNPAKGALVSARNRAEQQVVDFANLLMSKGPPVKGDDLARFRTAYLDTEKVARTGYSSFEFDPVKGTEAFEKLLQFHKDRLTSKGQTLEVPALRYH